MARRIPEAMALTARPPSSWLLISVICLLVLKRWQFLRHLAWVLQFLVLGGLQPEDSILIKEFLPGHLHILVAKATFARGTQSLSLALLPFLLVLRVRTPLSLSVRTTPHTQGRECPVGALKDLLHWRGRLSCEGHMIFFLWKEKVGWWKGSSGNRESAPESGLKMHEGQVGVEGGKAKWGQIVLKPLNCRWKSVAFFNRRERWMNKSCPGVSFSGGEAIVWVSALCRDLSLFQWNF